MTDRHSEVCLLRLYFQNRNAFVRICFLQRQKRGVTDVTMLALVVSDQPLAKPQLPSIREVCPLSCHTYKHTKLTHCMNTLQFTTVCVYEQKHSKWIHTVYSRSTCRHKDIHFTKWTYFLNTVNCTCSMRVWTNCEDTRYRSTHTHRQTVESKWAAVAIETVESHNIHCREPSEKKEVFVSFCRCVCMCVST